MIRRWSLPSAAPILAYVNAHVAVTGLDGKACVAGAAALVPDGDGVIFRNTFSCRNVRGDIVYRSTVLTATDPGARQIVLIGEGANVPQALLDASNTTVTLSAPAPSQSRQQCSAISSPASSTSSWATTTSLSWSVSCYGRGGLFR